MGASLDTPAECPLCSQTTSELVTLKCKHGFCQRCIEALWSNSPDGPFRCPKLRCETEYKTLPFSWTSRPRRSASSKRTAQTRSTAGTQTNEQSTTDSALRRPSLAGRLLGKRKASAPAGEQPDTKRLTVEASAEHCRDDEASSRSCSDSAGPEPSQTSDSQESECEEGTSASVKLESPDGGNDLSGQQGEPEPAVVVLQDDDNSLDEVIVCEAPAAAPPQRDPGEAPASPASAGSSAGASPPKTKPPVNKSPLTSKAQLASTSRSPGCFSSFPRVESKSSGPVPCNYCPKASSQPAVRTCLVCGASMCSEHLRPHLDSPVFQNHTLIPPANDLSSWRCLEHQEINRIYCQKCAVCVCTVCTVIGSHRHHPCVSIGEAERELRGNLKEKIAELQQIEEKVTLRLQDFEGQKEASRVLLDEAERSVQQQYAAIREALDEEEQTALLCVKKEESRVLVGLEDKLGQLKSFLLSVQQSLHVLEGLADAKGDNHIGNQAFIAEYSKTAQLTGAMGSYVEQFEAPEEVDRARLTCLQSWTERRLDTVVVTVLGKERDGFRLLYGCVPSLDPDTAYPKLQLSGNNREVTYSDTQQPYTDHVARFSSFPQVLASGALQGGHWYWEVKVSVDEGHWKVGVCEAQIERKGQKDSSRLGCNSYSWCLASDRNKVEALHNKVSEAVGVERLQRVGVFLNFEEGVLSFFSVTPGGSLALMHSYKHRFAEPVYPAFSVSKTHLAICDLYHC